MEPQRQAFGGHKRDGQPRPPPGRLWLLCPVILKLLGSRIVAGDPPHPQEGHFVTSKPPQDVSTRGSYTSPFLDHL
jgi:hypothetical protein